ncbi:MAG: hypothetical protein DRN91_00590, partial [Candidatus Alkanophagales archaeon]
LTPIAQAQTIEEFSFEDIKMFIEQQYNPNVDKLPGFIRNFFGNERMNVYIDGIVIGLVSKDGRIIEVKEGEISNPTVKVFVKKSTAGSIMHSDDPVTAFQIALKYGEIRVEGVGTVNWVKYSVGNAIIRIAGGLGILESPYDVRPRETKEIVYNGEKATLRLEGNNRVIDFPHKDKLIFIDKYGNPVGYSTKNIQKLKHGLPPSAGIYKVSPEELKEDQVKFDYETKELKIKIDGKEIDFQFSDMFITKERIDDLLLKLFLLEVALKGKWPKKIAEKKNQELKKALGKRAALLVGMRLAAKPVGKLAEKAAQKGGAGKVIVKLLHWTKKRLERPPNPIVMTISLVLIPSEIHGPQCYPIGEFCKVMDIDHRINRIIIREILVTAHYEGRYQKTWVEKSYSPNESIDISNLAKSVAKKYEGESVKPDYLSIYVSYDGEVEYERTKYIYCCLKGYEVSNVRVEKDKFMMIYPRVGSGEYTFSDSRPSQDIESWVTLEFEKIINRAESELEEWAQRDKSINFRRYNYWECLPQCSRW